MSFQELNALQTLAAPAKAAEMADYHKVERVYLGVATPEIDALAKDWRAARTLPERLDLAQALWSTDIHEGRIAAAKLLTQARIRPDDTAAWELICTWVPDFDGWAIADAVSSAGARRLVADPTRIETVASWVSSDHLWTRRAAFVMTLPWTKLRHPKSDDVAIRERVLGWAAGLTNDSEWFIQKEIARWLRDLNKHNPERVRSFVDTQDANLKPIAQNIAQNRLEKDKPSLK